MIGASNPIGQGFQCRMILRVRQLACNKPVSDGFSLRSGLKPFHSDTGKGIFAPLWQTT